MAQITRRTWLGASGLALAGACARKKGTGYPGYALIATSGDDSIAAVDLTRFELAKTISVGAAPSAIVPGIASKHSYVLTPGTGSVHVVDENLKVIASRKLADEIAEIRLTSDGKRLLAIARGQRQLILVDPIHLGVIGRYRLSAEPQQFDVSSSGQVAISSGRRSDSSISELRR